MDDQYLLFCSLFVLNMDGRILYVHFLENTARFVQYLLEKWTGVKFMFTLWTHFNHVYNLFVKNERIVVICSFSGHIFIIRSIIFKNMNTFIVRI